jgi:cell division protein FtsB
MKLAKSLTLATLALGLLGIGSITGSYLALSTIDFNSLEQRISQVENRSTLGVLADEIKLLKQRFDELEVNITSHQDISPLSQSDYSNSLADLEVRQSKLETEFYSLFSEQELQAESDPLSTEVVNTQDDNNDQVYASREQLQAGIELLDQASLSGALDNASMDQLNIIVEQLDRESKKRFWERMFADLQAGKYQLPDKDSSADYYELPNSEVVGE